MLFRSGAESAEAIVKKLERYGLQDRYSILTHRKDINEILKALDAFVFPSVFEGFPVSVIEAQAAGVRCVISDRIPRKVICTETCIPLPLEHPENWANAALDRDLTGTPVNDLQDYDMNREIRRLEKLYLGQLDL